MPIKTPDPYAAAPVANMLARSKAATVEDAQRQQEAQVQREIDSRGSFRRGLEQGMAGIGEAYHGVNAVRQALMGDEQGANEAWNYAQAYSNDAQRNTPEVSSVSQIDGVGSALSFAAGALGQAAPSLATVIAGGGLGGVIGKKLGETLIKKYAAREAKAVGARIGAAAGAYGTGIGLESGSLGSQLLDPKMAEAESVFGRKLDMQERALLSLAGGAAAGGLEALPVFNLLGRRGLGKELGDEVRRSFLSEAGKQALQEGSTEAAQQLVQRSALAVADKNREVLGEEGIQELIDSFAVGAIAGGTLGGASAMLPAGQTGQASGQDVQPRAGTDFAVDGQGNARPIAPWEQEADISPDRKAAFRAERAAFMASLDGVDNMDLGGYYPDMDFDAPYTQEEMGDYFAGSEVTGADYLAAQDRAAYADIYDEQLGGDVPDFTDLDERAPGEIAANEFGYTGGFAQGETIPNYEFAKTVKDGRGDVIRSLPWHKDEKGLGEAAAKRPDAEVVSHAEVVSDMARREYPDDMRGRRQFIADQARVVSESRNTKGQKLQDGQDPLEYLDQFRALRGQDVNTAESGDVRGRVPGDLSLTDDELSLDAKTYFGEIKDREGKPITDRKTLNSEKLRRQILRRYNDSTFNDGLNENADFRLADGNVLNTVSLVSAMRPKMNEQQRDSTAPLAKKVGEWFTAGVASLNAQGVSVDINSVPDTQKLYQGITWGQARKAMQATDPNATSADTKRAAADQLLKGLGETVPEARAAEVAAAVAKVTGKEVSPKAVAGMKTAALRKYLNRKGVSARTPKSVPDRMDITQEMGEGIESGKVEAAKQRPIKRDTRSTKPREYPAVSNPEKVRALSAAQDALRRSTAATVTKLVARKVAKAMSEATGRDIKPEQLEGKPREEVLKRVQENLKRGTDLKVQKVAPTQTGYANEQLTEDRDRILESEADLSPKQEQKQLRDQIQALRAARKALNGGVTGDALATALRNAGLERDGKTTKAQLLSRLDTKEAALTRRGVQLGDKNARNITAGQKLEAATGGGKASDEFKAKVEALVKAAEGESGAPDSKKFQDKVAQQNREFWAKQREKSAARARARMDAEIKEQNLTTGKGRKSAQPESFYEDWYNDANRDRLRMDGLLAAITKALGLKTKVRLATPAELRAKMDASPEWGLRVLRGQTLGSAFKVGDETLIFLNPVIKGVGQRVAVLAHEVGHVVFKEKFLNADKATKDAIFADFEKWRDQQTGDRTRGDAQRARVARSIVELAAFDKTLLNELSEKDRAYVLSFEEWFADQTARYFEGSEKPRSLVGKFFSGVAAYLKKVHDQLVAEGYMPANSVKEFYDALLADPVKAAQATEQSTLDAVQARQAEALGIPAELAPYWAEYQRAFRDANPNQEPTPQGFLEEFLFSPREYMDTRDGGAIEAATDAADAALQALNDAKKAAKKAQPAPPPKAQPAAGGATPPPPPPKKPGGTGPQYGPNAGPQPTNRANPSLSKAQVEEIKRWARAVFRADNANKYTTQTLTEFAATIAKMAGEHGSSMQFAAMMVAYNNFLNTAERKVIATALGTKSMQNKIYRMLKDAGNNQAAAQILADPDALAGWAYQLWSEGKLTLGPKSNNVFQRLYNRILKILGVATSGQRAEQMFTALQNNEILLRTELSETSWTFAAPRQMTDTLVQRLTRDARALTEAVAPAFRAVLQSAYSRMAGTKNPWLQKIAREFYVAPGTQGAGEGFFEAKNQRLAEYHNRVAQLLRGKSAAFKRQVVEGMNAATWSTDPEVKAAQQELKTLFEDLKKYADEAGVEMGNQAWGETGYFPWVFDTDQLLDPARRQEFVDLLVRTMPEDFASQYITTEDRKRVLRDKDKKATTDKALIANRVVDAIIHSMGYGDSPAIADYTAASHTPYFGSVDTRLLGFIKSDPAYAGFLSKDLDKTMIGYIDQIVKRSEFARRFGEHGAKIAEMMEKAERAGMTPAQKETATKFIQAMLGTLGGDLDPKWRKGMSYVMVYENLRLLAFATYSSLVDPNGIAVRSGSLTDTLEGMKAAAKEFGTYAKRKRGEKGGTHEARELAELLGIIEDSIAKEALGYEYGGAYMAGPARQINEKWFELIGIAGLTRMTRVMATAAAQSFIKRHKQGQDKDSTRYLDELGITADDVVLGADGKIKILSDQERAAATQEERDRDSRVRNAIFRFVDEAILRPDAAQRPLYGSDPRFMLVFHLKGFMYSFYERIMKRAWNEAVNHGRFAPAMTLSLYVPGMIAADMLRDATKDAFGDWDDDRKDEWDTADWVSHGLDRSGLYGPYAELLSSSAEDYTKWGKMPGLSMAGPAAEHLVDILSMKGGMESQLARALPAQNLLRPLGDSLMSN